MIWILLIYQIFLLNICNGEDPEFFCQIDKPYKSVKNRCADFIDICVKKDDPDCKNFQSVCQQCPPSNYSIMMFIDIMKVKNELIITKSKVENLTVQIEKQSAKNTVIYSKQNQLEEKMFALLVASLIIVSLSILIIILEVRFKIITKLFHLKESKYELLRSRKCQSRESKYELLRSRKCQSRDHKMDDIIKHNAESKIDTFLEKINDSIKQNIDSKTNAILEKIDNLIEFSRSTTKFVIEDYDKPIIYNLNTEDTVIKIKRELCDQFIQNKNYKLMKMKYDNIFLDDNENIFNRFSSLNATINCIFDTSIDASDILVLKFRGNIDVPNYFQVNKSQTVADLKTNLLSMKSVKSESINYKIFKDSKELQNDYSLTNFNDDDCFYFINGEIEQLEITSIFMKSNLITVNHNPAEKIKQLKRDIADQCSSQKENFFLFLKNQYLDENKYLFEYNMDYKGCLQYCCFKKLFTFEKLESIHKEPLYELFKTKLDQNNVLLKKYCLSESKKLSCSKYLLKELATFQITKLQTRFVQLLNIYKDDSNIYATMENIEQGTIVNVIEKNQSIENRVISKWTNQILEGLKFLHNKKIIYRAFNPSCILVNNDNDIKLHGLNLSNYTNLNKKSSLMSNFKKEELPIRYLSPEILQDKQYNEQTDVWSLGAVLIFMITGKDLYSDIENDAVIDKICNNSNFENQIPEQYKKGKLSDFIIYCLKLDQKDRPSCLKLLKHEFIIKQEN